MGTVTASAAAVARLRSIARVVRLQPFDVSTEEGRSLERYRRAVLTSGSSMIARVVTVATALVTVPLTVSYLGEERYGMWLTISTLLAFAAVADLGVTQGLQTAIARASGKDDRDTAIRYVSTAAAVLLVSTTVGALLLAAAAVLVPWSRVFNVHGSEAMAEAAPAAVAFGAGWLANILLAIVTRVNDGYQDGLLNNVWQTLGSLLGLAGVVLGIRAQVGLPLLMSLFVGGPVIANLANGVLLFARRRPWLFPRWRHVDRSLVRELLTTGFWYLLAGLSYAAMSMAATLSIAQLMTSGDVPDYGVPARVAAIGNMVLALIANPLWPAYAEALSRGDHAWVRRTMRRSLTVMLGAGLAFGIGLVLVGRPLVEWWVDGAVSPSWSMLAGLAAFTVLSGFDNALAMFLCANDAVRVFAMLWVTSVAVGVPLMIALVHGFGVDGVPWALFLSVCWRILPSAYYCRKVVRRLRGEA